MRILLIAALIAAGFGGNSEAQNLSGHYTVQGTNADGTTYTGTADITPSGAICRIVWKAGSEWRGVCMRSNNAFAAHYNFAGKDGLAVYELQPDGSLKGSWAVAGQVGSGTETLIPAR